MRYKALKIAFLAWRKIERREKIYLQKDIQRLIVWVSTDRKEKALDLLKHMMNQVTV